MILILSKAETIYLIFKFLAVYHTAIPYRASTGPEQGFPCVLFPHREKNVFVTGFPGDGNRFSPVRKSTQGKPCFHYRDGLCPIPMEILPSTTLSTNLESADQSKFNATMSLVDRSAEGQNFHHTDI